MGALLKIALLGNSVAGVAVFQRFLAGIAAAVVLTIMAAMLGGALLVAGFYGLYVVLSYSMAPQSAAEIVAVLVFLTAVVLFVFAGVQLRKLSHRSWQSSAPPFSQLAHVVDAFIAGLKSPREGYRGERP